jgi:hypothetical protein
MITGGRSGKTTGKPIGLIGIGSYDPDGDQREHTERAGFATDSNFATYWTTEQYRSFTKSGVGLVLDAGRPIEASQVRLRTDTPGYTAQVLAGNLLTGPFPAVSEPEQVAGATTFDVDPKAPARYYVIWITSLTGDVAHINEVRAFGG